jgi:hypothetical protein
MNLRIEQAIHGVDNVVGGERSSIGEGDAAPQVKRDPPALLIDLPGRGEFRNELLGDAMDAQEDAAGQIADGLGIVIVHQDRIECLGIGVEAEAQFGSGLCQGCAREGEQ